MTIFDCFHRAGAWLQVYHPTSLQQFDQAEAHFQRSATLLATLPHLSTEELSYEPLCCYLEILDLAHPHIQHCCALLDSLASSTRPSFKSRHPSPLAQLQVSLQLLQADLFDSADEEFQLIYSQDVEFRRFVEHRIQSYEADLLLPPSSPEPPTPLQAVVNQRDASNAVDPPVASADSTTSGGPPPALSDEAPVAAVPALDPALVPRLDAFAEVSVDPVDPPLNVIGPPAPLSVDIICDSTSVSSPKDATATMDPNSPVLTPLVDAAYVKAVDDDPAPFAARPLAAPMITTTYDGALDDDPAVDNRPAHPLVLLDYDGALDDDPALDLFPPRILEVGYDAALDDNPLDLDCRPVLLLAMYDGALDDDPRSYTEVLCSAATASCKPGHLTAELGEGIGVPSGEGSASALGFPYYVPPTS